MMAWVYKFPLIDWRACLVRSISPGTSCRSTSYWYCSSSFKTVVVVEVVVVEVVVVEVVVVVVEVVVVGVVVVVVEVVVVGAVVVVFSCLEQKLFFELVKTFVKIL